VTLAQELAEFAAGCRDKGVPAAVRADVPHRILDIVGLALAAYPGSPDGLTGPPTALEGRFGFYAAHTGAFDADAVVAGLGERWELLRTVYKPYPSNHFTHPGIDCALALRAAGLDPAAIDAVELAVPGPVLRTIAEPAAEKAHPRSAYHAKFSGPYTVAAALLGGGGLGLALSDFEHLDEARLALAARVTCVADERASALFPHAFAAALTVTTVDGRQLTHRVDSSRGGPEHPLTADELTTKFATNASRTVPAAQVRSLQTAVLNGAAAATILRLAQSP